MITDLRQFAVVLTGISMISFLDFLPREASPSSLFSACIFMDLLSVEESPSSKLVNCYQFWLKGA